MKIVELQAENFKRLKAVEIKPNGNLIEIRGKNSQGKTSVLDAIWAAVGGGDVLPQKPIRRGAETARIRLDLGELIVTRRFRPSGSDVVVEAASGARFRRPQRMLDELIGMIAFDPLEFTRLPPDKQLDSLRNLAHIETDIDALDGQNASDYEKRTDLNREAKRLRGQASGIQYPTDLPATPIATDPLTARLGGAGEINSGIEAEKRHRQDRFDVVADKDVERERVLETAAERRAKAASLLREADQWELSASKLAEEIALGREELAGFLENPVPDLVDTAALVAELEEARATNGYLEAKRRRDTLEAEATACEARSAALTEAMEERTRQKEAAVAAAEMPVAGLSLGDGEVLYNGIPLAQAGEGEKIRISVAIAMAANPTLKVLCVRDGSLLDADSMRVLADMVTEHDYQCWIEVTDDEAKTGVIIEDGEVRGAPSPELERAQPALALEDAD